MIPMRPESPNHALQRTGSAVTAPAADHRHLSTLHAGAAPLRRVAELGVIRLTHEYPRRVQIGSVPEVSQ